MGGIKEHRKTLLIVAAISRYDLAIEWARQRIVQQWGKIALESSHFLFDSTTYYETTMGKELRKAFFAMERLVDPAELAQFKHITNGWEISYAEKFSHAEQRPLNLDPGYITEAKLVLATTKDRDHRVCLQEGIYAEVTLYFHGKKWRGREWTYPDYQREDYHQFFTLCRDYLRGRYRE